MRAEPATSDAATIERAARVLGIDRDRVRLAAAPSCSNCSGCGGRCGLIGALAATETIELDLSLFDQLPHPGQSVRIYLPDHALLARARIGYGLPLAGLLLGAALGQALGSWLNAPADLFSVAGALAGTLSGLSASKRAILPSCRVAPAGEPGTGPTIPIECNEERLP